MKVAAVLCAMLLLGPLPISGAPAKADGDVYAFTAQVQDKVYAFPCAVAALETGGGFVPLANPNEPFEPGQYADVEFESRAGRLTVRVANTGEETLPLARCAAIGLVADAAQEDALPVAFSGGLALGASRAEVLAACGTPDEAEDGAEAETVQFTVGRGAFLRFCFGLDDTAVRIEMQNPSPAAAPPDAEGLPPEAARYAAPDALGDDPWSYTIEYDGDLYALPAPVAAFETNGWRLRDEAVIEPGGWLIGVSLARGTEVLRTRVYNLSATPQPLSGCFVVMAESSKVSFDKPLRLPGGLHQDATIEEMVALLGTGYVLDVGLNSREYIYDAADGAGRIVLRFRTDDLTLFDLEVWHWVL